MVPYIASTTELERELGVGEQVLWSGQPKRGLRLRAADAFLIPFSLRWAGFAVVWESGLVSSAAPFFLHSGVSRFCASAPIALLDGSLSLLLCVPRRGMVSPTNAF